MVKVEAFNSTAAGKRSTEPSVNMAASSNLKNVSNKSRTLRHGGDSFGFSPPVKSNDYDSECINDSWQAKNMSATQTRGFGSLKPNARLDVGSGTEYRSSKYRARNNQQGAGETIEKRSRLFSRTQKRRMASSLRGPPGSEPRQYRNYALNIGEL